MDRMTHKDKFGRYVLPEVDDWGEWAECREICDKAEGCDNCPIQRAIDRLAAYENTGLTSEEIEQMKADNARLHDLLDNIECVMRGE